MENTTYDTALLRAFPNQMADAVARAAPSLVTVIGRARQAGSGIVIAPELMITASHILERENDIKIQSHEQTQFSATLVTLNISPGGTITKNKFPHHFLGKPFLA